MMKYDDDKIEYISQDEIKDLQLSLFNQQLQRANCTQAYRGKLPNKINSFSDIKNIPFTTKEDLRQNFPYGFLAVSKEKIARFNASSGTTGIPTLIFFTQQDIDYITKRGIRHLNMAELTSDNIVQSMLGSGLFVGGWYHNLAAFGRGITILPTGTGNTKRQITLLKQLKADCIFTTSGYLQYLLSQLTEKDLADINLKKALVGAEPLSRSFCEIAQKKYGIEVYESYGMTEMGGPLSHECSLHKGLHVAEDQVYIEIINPETGENVPDGEYGELVITPLQQEAMPFIRYRTRDITRIIPNLCPCGRTHRKIEPPSHRADDMIIVNGVNIFPSQIEECIYKHLPVSTNYLVHIIKNEGLKKVVVDIELTKNLLVDEGCLKKLEKDLTQTLKSYITVSPKLNFISQGTLPDIQGKVKRILME